VKVLQDELGVAHIDTRVYEQEKFLMEDAQDLVRIVQTTPLGGEKTLTVIAVDQIGHNAQNALLKIAEEPPEHAHIVLIVQSEDMLLPTLLSRFVRAESITAVGDMSVAEEFLKSTTAARQKINEKILKEKDSLTGKKLIRDLESIFAKRGDLARYKDEISDLMKFRQYVEQRGASLKYMLEHLALTLPQVK
jgi:DNA polymerase-3 subunit delta'